MKYKLTEEREGVVKQLIHEMCMVFPYLFIPTERESDETMKLLDRVLSDRVYNEDDRKRLNILRKMFITKEIPI